MVLGRKWLPLLGTQLPHKVVHFSTKSTAKEKRIEKCLRGKNIWSRCTQFLYIRVGIHGEVETNLNMEELKDH